MATVYWYGGTGNWSDHTNHWSNNSGNSPASAHGSVPGTDDDVVFDTASSAAEAAYTVTVDATANCQNFTMDGPSTTDATKVTWAGNFALNIYGNLDLLGGTAGITSTYGSILTFKATSGTKTIRSYGVVILSSFVIDGNGGTFQLLDNLTVNKGLQLTSGTFDTTTNNTKVTFQGSGWGPVGTITFYDLSVIPASPSATNSFYLSNNITVNNTFTVTGGSSVNRMLVLSNILGTARTITAAAISVSNADFQDITGAGDATWDMSAATGGSGNCGGNSMKALGDAAFTTADTWYWHADTGNVSDYTKWYTETNGGGSQMASTLVPLPQDTLRFDDSSFTAGSKTVTQNMPRIGSVDFTNATNTPTYNQNSVAFSYFGSVTFISGMNITNGQLITLAGTTNTTITSAGKIFGSNTVYILKPGAIVTLKDDTIISSSGTVRVTTGTLSVVDGANNWSITAYNLYITGGTLTLGSATHYITGVSGYVFDASSGTLTANTSTIKLTGTITASNYVFNGSGKTTFYNIWNATTGAYPVTILGSNTFNDFKIDAGRTVKFTNSTNTTVNTFTAIGTSGSHIVISNTSSTTHATLTKAGGGVISGCDYIDIQEMTGSPANTWYIGPNSTDTGSTCTNIYLSDEPPTSTARIHLLASTGVGS